MPPEQHREADVELRVCEVHTKAHARSTPKDCQIVYERLDAVWAARVPEPSFRSKDLGRLEHAIVHMHVVLVHANRRASWNGPVAVGPGTGAVDAHKALDHAQANAQG